ncbi:hypothetical protein A343_0074 [Porphyromonas gingivalis JCVI SC001]|nr:hypothetical protein A343_0074 [Porphyromonas gingivalis JCVI SC001]
MVKVKDNWLIYFDAYQIKTYDAVSTKDFVSFTDISKQVSIPAGHKHGTIVPVKKNVLQQLLKNLNKQ